MQSRVKLGRVFSVELGLHYSWFIIAFMITFSLAAHLRQVNGDWQAGSS
jgi:hypothetical protein